MAGWTRSTESCAFQFSGRLKSPRKKDCRNSKGSELVPRTASRALPIPEKTPRAKPSARNRGLANETENASLDGNRGLDVRGLGGLSAGFQRPPVGPRRVRAAAWIAQRGSRSETQRADSAQPQFS